MKMKVMVMEFVAVAVTLVCVCDSARADFIENFESFYDGQAIPGVGAWEKMSWGSGGGTRADMYTAAGTGIGESMAAYSDDTSVDPGAARSIGTVSGDLQIGALVNPNVEGDVYLFMGDSSIAGGTTAWTRLYVGLSRPESSAVGNIIGNCSAGGAATWNASQYVVPTGFFEMQVVGTLVDGEWSSATLRIRDVDDSTGSPIGSWSELATCTFGGALEVTHMAMSVGRSDGAFDNVYASSSTIPEPSTLALLAAGLVGLLCYAWRKRK